MGAPIDPTGPPPPSALEVQAVALPVPTATRWRVFREFALFQIKLLTDGLKDLVLSPVSMVILVIGLISPRQAAPLWRWIYRIGRTLDDWIDLFPDPDGAARGGRSGPTMHSALTQAEALVVALRRGGVADPHVQAQLAAVVRTLGAVGPATSPAAPSPGPSA